MVLVTFHINTYEIYLYYLIYLFIETCYFTYYINMLFCLYQHVYICVCVYHVSTSIHTHIHTLLFIPTYIYILFYLYLFMYVYYFIYTYFYIHTILFIPTIFQKLFWCWRYNSKQNRQKLLLFWSSLSGDCFLLECSTPFLFCFRGKEFVYSYLFIIKKTALLKRNSHAIKYTH